MKSSDAALNSRRRLLIQALTTGLFSSALPGANALADSIFGSKPMKLPAHQSIYRITGQALVNGKPATLQTRITPGDTISTGQDSELIFVIGGHAMLLRNDSRLVIEAGIKSAAQHLIKALRLLNGKLLSVSRDAPMRIETESGSIGIRGTGFYVESSPEQTYFCTCYGVTEVAANAEPGNIVTVSTQHHDRPLYILKTAERGRHIRDAPFINHTDQELTLIEAIVGRTTPFVFSNDAYSTPRLEY